MILIRRALEQAEREARALRDEIPTHEDAYDRVDELCEMLDNIFSDYLKPCEEALNEWLAKEDER